MNPAPPRTPTGDGTRTVADAGEGAPGAKGGRKRVSFAGMRGLENVKVFKQNEGAHASALAQRDATGPLVDLLTGNLSTVTEESSRFGSEQGVESMKSRHQDSDNHPSLTEGRNSTSNLVFQFENSAPLGAVTGDRRASVFSGAQNGSQNTSSGRWGFQFEETGPVAGLLIDPRPSLTTGGQTLGQNLTSEARASVEEIEPATGLTGGQNPTSKQGFHFDGTDLNCGSSVPARGPIGTPNAQLEDLRIDDAPLASINDGRSSLLTRGNTGGDGLTSRWGTHFESTEPVIGVGFEGTAPTARFLSTAQGAGGEGQPSRRPANVSMTMEVTEVSDPLEGWELGTTPRALQQSLMSPRSSTGVLIGAAGGDFGGFSPKATQLVDNSDTLRMFDVPPDIFALEPANRSQNITFMEFVQLAGMDFTGRFVPRRSMLTPITPRQPPATLKDSLVQLALTAVELEKYTTTIAELQKDVKEQQKLTQALEGRLAANNPPIFKKMQFANGRERVQLKAQLDTLKACCSLRASHKWRQKRKKMEEREEDILKTVVRLIKHDNSYLESIITSTKLLNHQMEEAAKAGKRVKETEDTERKAIAELERSIQEIDAKNSETERRVQAAEERNAKIEAEVYANREKLGQMMLDVQDHEERLQTKAHSAGNLMSASDAEKLELCNLNFHLQSWTFLKFKQEGSALNVDLQLCDMFHVQVTLPTKEAKAQRPACGFVGMVEPGRFPERYMRFAASLAGIQGTSTALFEGHPSQTRARLQAAHSELYGVWTIVNELDGLARQDPSRPEIHFEGQRVCLKTRHPNGQRRRAAKATARVSLTIGFKPKWYPYYADSMAISIRVDRGSAPEKHEQEISRFVQGIVAGEDYLRRVWSTVAEYVSTGICK
ncbi:unnamed protein product [Ostreobium quekettii]|uniref:Spc7 kinetochore protein domain-containing protein n=1 Tax=Ostreobium quekettii TaxID=121088 RepID=A0A8S1ILS7_9CHLO|nr:unnamed protein product [Ostreobium quekettii]|eukprot:evm.model.scf_1139.2 EVM.evm.TU.scf_1139.2   scf_1139:24841-33891(-)